MRRFIVWAGVLSCIVASDGGAQSSTGPRAYCPVGSTDCAPSYFDVAASHTATLFDLLLWDLFAADRRSSKLALRPVVIPRLPESRSESSFLFAADADTRDRLEREARGEEGPAGERARKSNNSTDITRRLGEWGWPGFEFDDPRGRDGGDRSREGAPRDGPASGSPPAESPRGDRGDGPGHEFPNDRRPPELPENPDRPHVVEPGPILTPEPSTLVLVGTGIPIAFAFFRSRRRR